MNTLCHKQLDFGSLLGKEIWADFDGGRITSDGGALLLGEIDKRYGICDTAAQCIDDRRDAGRITHELRTLVKQRVLSIALGYEDNNDANTLREDPALKSVTGRLPETGGDLASQPTLSRLENAVSKRDVPKLSEALFDLYLQTHPGPRDLIIVDIDATDDPTHGQQQFSFFHGYYDEHMYHPLLVFDGQSGFPMAAVLRPGNTHSSHKAGAILKRIIRRLKKAYPEAEILIRADAGFAVPGLYRLCEREKVHYLIGLITNDRLRERSRWLLARAQSAFAQSGEKQRLFTSFFYRAKSWTHRRRVIAKVEYADKGSNQRFVVTNVEGSPGSLYDALYVARGDAENRIKELKVELRADRLSCHLFLANQFRLLLHVFSYTLCWLLRRHLQGTELQAAQVGTLRVKLFKIGARVKETTRRVWFHFASSYPYKELFAVVLQRIRAAPA